MDTAHILQFVDEVLNAKTGKRLNDLQRKIIEGILNRQKYSDIADTYGCTPGHAKDIGYKLLQMLSDVFGEPIDKGNLESVLERQLNLNINFGDRNTTNFGNSNTTSYINVCSEQPTTTTDKSQPPNPESQTKKNQVKIEAVGKLRQLGLSHEQIAEVPRVSLGGSEADRLINKKLFRGINFMFAVVTPEKIHLPPGTVMKFPGTWQDYQALVQQLGDRQIPRIKYRPGEILLMSPLPVHGRQAHIIAMVAMVLLDYLGLEYEAFTPITMDLPEVRGIEPDYCFYIDNWAAIAGKDRIAWGVEPPPDLAIEVDVTSYTDVNDYLPYRVPEVWLFKQNRLRIYCLEGEGYIETSISRFFPNFNISELVLECYQMSRDRNTSVAIRELRRKVDRENP